MGSSSSTARPPPPKPTCDRSRFVVLENVNYDHDFEYQYKAYPNPDPIYPQSFKPLPDAPTPHPRHLMDVYLPVDPVDLSTDLTSNHEAGYGGTNTKKTKEVASRSPSRSSSSRQMRVSLSSQNGKNQTTNSSLHPVPSDASSHPLLWETYTRSVPQYRDEHDYPEEEGKREENSLSHSTSDTSDVATEGKEGQNGNNNNTKNNNNTNNNNHTQGDTKTGDSHSNGITNGINGRGSHPNHTLKTVDEKGRIVDYGPINTKITNNNNNNINFNINNNDNNNNNNNNNTSTIVIHNDKNNNTINSINNNTPITNPGRLIPIHVHIVGGGWQRGSHKDEWRGGPSMGRSGSTRGLITFVVAYRLSAPSLVALILRAMLFALIPSALIKLSTWLALSPEDDPSYNTLYWLTTALFYIIALIYRMINPLVQHPDHINDVAQAIVWIRNNAKKIHPLADSNCVLLSGHSAGGHLASLLVTDPSYIRQADTLYINGKRRGQETDNNNNINNNNINNNNNNNTQNNIPSSSDPTLYIKGLVLISGIYTVAHPLHSFSWHPRNLFFKGFYAGSAFGFKPGSWDAASPYEMLQKYYTHLLTRKIPDTTTTIDTTAITTTTTTTDTTNASASTAPSVPIAGAPLPEVQGVKGGRDSSSSSSSSSSGHSRRSKTGGRHHRLKLEAKVKRDIEREREYADRVEERAEKEGSLLSEGKERDRPIQWGETTRGEDDTDDTTTTVRGRSRSGSDLTVSKGARIAEDVVNAMDMSGILPSLRRVDSDASDIETDNDYDENNINHQYIVSHDHHKGEGDDDIHVNGVTEKNFSSPTTNNKEDTVSSTTSSSSALSSSSSSSSSSPAKSIPYRGTSFPPVRLINASFDLWLESDAARFYLLLLKYNIPVDFHIVPFTNHASVGAGIDRHEGGDLLFGFIGNCAMRYYQHQYPKQNHSSSM